MTNPVDEVIAERMKDYGPPDENFRRIALGWTAIFGTEVTPVDVALALDWVKTSRLIATPAPADSWLDKLGYTALGEVLATNSELDVDPAVPPAQLFHRGS